MEAITITPRATRESSSSPESHQRAQARSRGAHTHAPAKAGSGRSEPWRRSLSPLAQRAKAPPPPSLLSERRPGPAEPPNTHQRKRDRAAASLGGDHHHPSRIARKLLLPRASSASAGPIPRSLQTRTSESGIGPQRALEAITTTTRASRESFSLSEPPQRAEARSRGAPPMH